MFILPNNKQINYEAVIDAILDQTKENIYWLDVDTGECLPETVIIKNNGKMNFENGKNSRYFKVPKVYDFDRLQWMASYITEMVENEDKGFAKRLEEIMQYEKPYDNFIGILEEKEDEGWIYGWSQWERDNAFEEMIKWFDKLPFEIREEMDIIDDNCPICRAMKEGRISEKELKNAFREANFKNAMKDIYGEKK